MLVGVRGTLVSEYFAEHLLSDRFVGRLGESGREAARKALDRLGRARVLLGPASSVRAVFDLGTARLVETLGFRVTRLVPFSRRQVGQADEASQLAALLEGGLARIGALVVSWGHDLNAAWRDSIRVGIEFDVRWCLLFNGRQVRLVDSSRSYGRDHIEFDLDGVCDDVASFRLFWALMRAEAFAARPDAQSLLDEIVAMSARHGVGVCRSLREGVLSALAALMQGFVDAGNLRSPLPPFGLRQGHRATAALATPPAQDGPGRDERGEWAAAVELLFEQSLTIVYRLLFLLFAEARRLVPTWHSIYRRAYSIETLRAAAEQGGGSAEIVGLWETFQAISRLAHRGCRAGSLVVTPFNGRLFSPSRTPLGESGRLDDDVARQVIIALSTEHTGAGRNRTRIAYRDLGVEQLGAVYERVLDYEPQIDALTADGECEADSVRPSTTPPARSGRTAGAGSRDYARKPCPGRSVPVEARTKGAAAEGTGERRNASRPRLVVRLESGSGRRKATGTFYTPHPLTGYLVRRTLHPLVERAGAEQILALRVLDPAMGSGAFLVAACQYLAARYEQALVAEGQLHPADVSERDRALFRRSVAQRCLFGVDRNPMAVQLARLSLWLATLAADCPLTFLDHHLAVGDSLVGASLMEMLRCPPLAGERHAAGKSGAGQGTLFDADELRADLERLLPERLRVGNEPGNTLAAVQSKERVIQGLGSVDGPVSRWKDVADLWCACWFWDREDAPTRGVYQDVVDALLRRRAALPDAPLRALTDHARAVAASRKFFHWQIEFPEAFFDSSGAPLPNAGFDAVIGNPPWDMLRADARAPSRRPDTGVRRSSAGGLEKAYDRTLTRFARGSGFYSAQSDGHANRFQLFVERAFHLARRRGRIGLVVPWGLFSDRGCSGLRRLLFGRADTDSILAFDNAKAIFPIHRSVRFALVTMSTGGPTARTLCRFGEQDVGFLDNVPEVPDERTRRTFYPIVLSPALLTQLSGDDLGVPDLRSPLDLEIVESVTSTSPWLSARDGWNAHFGRELNATDDRQHFVEKSARPATREPSADHHGQRLLPILEGKHLEPFVAHVAGARFLIPAEVARSLLARADAFRQPRLAYRDVASATNRVTLIAALLPADCVTTHTLFCLKSALEEDAQWFLCGVMNSYVANYLVRLRVTTHVSSGIIERLPVPYVAIASTPASEVITVARQLAARLPGVRDDRLQALVARLYGLTDAQFSHILETFPLVEKARRDGALAEFVKLP